MDLIEMEFRSKSIFYAKPYKCKTMVSYVKRKKMLTNDLFNDSVA